MATSTVKAVRATIQVGNEVLDCYQLPSGKYFLSLTQVARSIDMSLKRMSELRELKVVKALAAYEFQESEKCKVEGGTKPVNIISTSDVTAYWLLASTRGNDRATALMLALAQESLERRADAAFGVVRSEEERNAWLAKRLEHKKTFHPMYTKWLLADANGDRDKVNWGKEVNLLKVAAQLPLTPCELYDKDQLFVLSSTEIQYDMCRKLGLTHTEALKKLMESN